MPGGHGGGAHMAASYSIGRANPSLCKVQVLCPTAATVPTEGESGLGIRPPHRSPFSLSQHGTLAQSFDSIGCKASFMQPLARPDKEASHSTSHWICPNSSMLQSFCLDTCLGHCIPVRQSLHAGAYWRGDEHKAQLQRIYGTAWESADQLKAYQTFKEEAARRSAA